MNTDDVLEFIVAGASAVQIGTVQFIRPRIALDILDGLGEALKEIGAGSIGELVGTLETDRDAITVRQGDADEGAGEPAGR